MQSSVWNFGVWSAGSTAGFVAGGLGWVAFFPIAASAAAIGGIFYIVMFDRIEDIVQEREREELGTVEGDPLNEQT
jgi:sensor domain CHASE-containing protein